MDDVTDDDEPRAGWWHGRGAYALYGPFETRERAIRSARDAGHRYVTYAVAAENDEDGFERIEPGKWLDD